METERMIPAPARLLAGTAAPTSEAWEPFAQEAVGFLDAFSKALRADVRLRTDPEAMALAFWCRRAHLEALRRRHCGGDSPARGSVVRSHSIRAAVRGNDAEKKAVPVRLGRGLLFHLAPANVPMMFAYTWIIGLLAGNAGIVRISERTLGLETVQAVLEVLGGLFGREEYEAVRARACLITYAHSDAVTEEILSHCDGRVLWGGDETIRQLRRIPMPAHGVELAFPDRVSMAVISETELEKRNDDELRNLVHRFYNDTYVMDQNGCSSPQTVIWLRDPEIDSERDIKKETGPGREPASEGRPASGVYSGTEAAIENKPVSGTDARPLSGTEGGQGDVREKWWYLLAREAEAEYGIDGFRAARKLEKATLAAMREGTLVTAIRRCRGNALYVLRLSALPPDLAAYKGGFGLFYEAETDSVEEIFHSFSDRIQTIVCIGIEPDQMAAAAFRAHSAGALRFVEAGQALQMDTVWDGTDLIEALSRRIESTVS